jgi:hypothetical protein
MRRALAPLLASLVLASCSPARGPGPTVSLRMVGSPKAASVTIDDRFVGTLDVVSARGVALPPGSHRVTVEAPGHFPFDKMIEAKEGSGPLRLEVKLLPMPE